MDIKRRDAVLALIGYSSTRKDFGRTALQKVAYFAAIKLGLQLGHQAYYYGPFSTTVEEETQALVLSGLVTESAQSLGFINKVGQPALQYSYSLTDDGRARLAELELVHNAETTALKATIDALIDTVGSLDQRVLSLAAKMYFITDEQGTAVTPEQIRTLAKEKNWDLTNYQIQRVARLLAQLDLIDLS